MKNIFLIYFNSLFFEPNKPDIDIIINNLRKKSQK